MPKVDVNTWNVSRIYINIPVGYELKQENYNLFKVVKKRKK